MYLHLWSYTTLFILPAEVSFNMVEFRSINPVYVACFRRKWKLFAMEKINRLFFFDSSMGSGAVHCPKLGYLFKLQTAIRFGLVFGCFLLLGFFVSLHAGTTSIVAADCQTSCQKSAVQVAHYTNDASQIAKRGQGQRLLSKKNKKGRTTLISVYS